MQSLFDPQIEGIVNRIMGELEWLQTMGHLHQVQYMVLSGGLGSSTYVRDQLQKQFLAHKHPNTSDHVAVIPCNDPQLVVVRGLLLDRQQRWESGGATSVLSTRIARASYGVVVQEVYVPEVHGNEDVRPDPFEKNKKWAVNQIQWLIKKGDQVNPNVFLVKSFQIRLAATETTRAWNSHIVISHKDPVQLPTSMKQGWFPALIPFSMR